MFNLFVREKSKNVVLDLKLGDYWELTQKEKIHILNKLLDDSFEIYFRTEGDIMLFNTITREFVDENGIGACNLKLFFEGPTEDCNCVPEFEMASCE
jgi:hypothetical protein